MQGQDQVLFEQIVKHVGEFIESDVSHLTPESRLATSIQGMSSMKMFELLLYLEDCFNINFSESVMDKLDTMQDLVTYVRDLKAAAPEAASAASAASSA